MQSVHTPPSPPPLREISSGLFKIRITFRLSIFCWLGLLRLTAWLIKPKSSLVLTSVNRGIFIIPPPPTPPRFPQGNASDNLLAHAFNSPLCVFQLPTCCRSLKRSRYINGAMSRDKVLHFFNLADGVSLFHCCENLGKYEYFATLHAYQSTALIVRYTVPIYELEYVRYMKTCYKLKEK